MRATATVKILHIGEVVNITDTFGKLTVIVETEEKYPQVFDVEVHKGKTEFKEKFKVGDRVDMEFDIRGKEWSSGDKTIYFKTLVAWKTTKAGAAKETDDELPSEEVPTRTEDDLPF